MPMYTFQPRRLDGSPIALDVAELEHDAAFAPISARDGGASSPTGQAWLWHTAGMRTFPPRR